jgi:hypothetical protein
MYAMEDFRLTVRNFRAWLFRFRLQASPRIVNPDTKFKPTPFRCLSLIVEDALVPPYRKMNWGSLAEGDR